MTITSHISLIIQKYHDDMIMNNIADDNMGDITSHMALSMQEYHDYDNNDYDNHLTHGSEHAKIS